jgi:hypothetical protein
MFFVRDEGTFGSLVQDWAELICYRDLQQLKTLRLEGELALRLLEQTSVLEEPTCPAIARALGVDGRRVASHLRALCELFVLRKLDSHPSGGGKAIYLPLDAGVARFFGASLIRRLHVTLLNEKLVSDACSKGRRAAFYYYRSTGKRPIHLLEERMGRIHAYQVMEREAVRKTDAELMAAFLRKNPGSEGTVFAPVLHGHRVKGISFRPWEESLWRAARGRR